MPDNPNMQELPNDHFEKVGSNWIYYDTVCIGQGWKQTNPNWFNSFSEMADAPEITFFSVRTSSKTDSAYTNMDSSDQIGRPFRLESIGMRWIYPDPHISDPHQMNITASKVFQMYLPEHCHVKFWIRDDQWATLKPMMMPSGYGVKGSAQLISDTPSSNTVLTNGDPVPMNRFPFSGNGIKIPETSQIKAALVFSKYGKDMLRKLDQVWPLDGTGEDPFPSVAMIEMGIRGLRYAQMRGKYYK